MTDLATATVSRQGIVTGWSVGAQRLLGHPATDVVGRDVTELLAADPSDAAWAALAGVGPWSGTAALRHRDGSRRHLGLRAYPSLDGEGKANGFVVAFAPEPIRNGDRGRDGDEYKEAQGEREADERGLLELSFTQAPVALATFDAELRYQRLNDIACEMLGTTAAQLHGRRYPDTVSDNVATRGFLRHLRQVAETGTPTSYDSDFGGRAWNIEMWPVKDPSGRVRGVSTASFDSSAQYWAQQRLALLNEAGTRIGTTLDVVRTAQELTELVVPRLADFVSVDLLDSVLKGEEPTAEPIDAAVVLRRVAHRSAVAGVPEAAVALGAVDTYPAYSPPARCLAAGRPFLSGLEDPDFVRWIKENDVRSAGVHHAGVHSGMAVPLRARGITLGVAVFWRRLRPEPFQPDDLVLAEELAGRAAVCVDNARRYTREYTAALTLQRSLLPRALPGQAAVEAAFRYLPAGSEAGAGGDWFDVIPLSGTRVALVVGDVAGHGVRASATMGSLRTAVRTLADVDLPPDELLTHLDDLVTHLTADDDGTTDPGDGTAPADAQDAEGISATCLYAVYDPVTRLCTLASAGHPPPGVLHPDGSVTLVSLSPGPPLGVGGLPFEATELELAEGSLIALYTDGLIEARDRDIDAGLDRLCQALARPSPSLEVTCDTLIDALLPAAALQPGEPAQAGEAPQVGEAIHLSQTVQVGEPPSASSAGLRPGGSPSRFARPADDVALLVARTRALHTDQVATWGLPADPEIVADARLQASRQLQAWGLEEVGFITELVVSELVTNAIRYGSAPIQLRLIRDRTLICEVSDGNSAAPHLRRARTFDEGGRGLLLVSQLTQGWGTRQTTSGKTIWAEQLLPTGHAGGIR
ncbi:SpoIIE family protein phosphatase [Streptomyces sp. NBC_00878]|uniref:SpoIIE family protein phosphatase n=1 Tax=Streptomyces sp. NBC_00878 TaxID=2975854 RepID=UPI002254981A|nr:SpoIIE family protein phosphatase [Streptomyces sp. NBC_00878]MCX4905250.1 SpoIIE family protein phosphatase [Streptomyces sp. NBC_00878]